MYWHPEDRLLYLASPRTASRATAEALLELGFDTDGVHHSSLSDHRPPGFGDGWRIFTAVRNHFDALLSWAAHEPRTRSMPWGVEALGELVRRMGWSRDDAGGYELFPHRHRCDHLIRYETLEEDLFDVLDVPVDLSRRGVSDRGRELGELYDTDTIGRVWQLFGREIYELGYGFP